MPKPIKVGLNLKLFIMNLFKKTAIFLVVALFAFTSCKYEEGPAVSLLSKKARLSGEWTVDKVMYDGEELTGDEMKMYEAQTVTFEKDGTGNIHTDAYSMDYNGTTVDIPESDMSLEWEFNDDKTKLKVRTKMEDSEEWSDWSESEILKLENKEAWFVATQDDVTVETHYKKK